MPQQPRPDPQRAARARTVAIRLADVLDGEGVAITWPRFLQIQDLVADMLPPTAPSDGTSIMPAQQAAQREM